MRLCAGNGTYTLLAPRAFYVLLSLIFFARRLRYPLLSDFPSSTASWLDEADTALPGLRYNWQKVAGPSSWHYTKGGGEFGRRTTSGLPQFGQSLCLIAYLTTWR